MPPPNGQEGRNRKRKLPRGVGRPRHQYLTFLDGIGPGLNDVVDRVTDSVDRVSDSIDRSMDDLDRRLDEMDTRLERSADRREARLERAKERIEEARERIEKKAEAIRDRSTYDGEVNIAGRSVTVNLKGRPLDQESGFIYRGQYHRLRFNRHWDYKVSSDDGVVFDDGLRDKVFDVIREELHNERAWKKIGKPTIKQMTTFGSVGDDIGEEFTMDSIVEVEDSGVFGTLLGNQEPYTVTVDGKKIHMRMLDSHLYLRNDLADMDPESPPFGLTEWLKDWTDEELYVMLEAMRGIIALGHAKPHHETTLAALEWWNDHGNPLRQDAGDVQV